MTSSAQSMENREPFSVGGGDYGSRPGGVNIIAVASGKGGVGKTWLAITLAHAMARKGRRVLLFDGDLGLANVDIQLGLIAQHDLGNVMGGEKTLNQIVTSCEATGFDVIAGRSGSGSLAGVPPGRLQLLLEDLAITGRTYDRVIVDLGSGLGRVNRMMGRLAGTILLVTNDEPASLADAYAFIRQTLQDRKEADIRIVINSANSTREGERTYHTLLKACQGFLKVSPPLSGIIRRDARVREAVRNQAPILTRFPNSEAALDVESLTLKLLESA